MASRPSIPILDDVQCTRRDGHVVITCTARKAGEEIILFEEQGTPGEILKTLEILNLPIVHQQALLLAAAQRAPSCEAAQILTDAASLIGNILRQQADLWQMREESLKTMHLDGTKKTTVLQKTVAEAATTGPDGTILPPKTDKEKRIIQSPENISRNAREPQILLSIGLRLAACNLLNKDDARRLPHALGYGSMPEYSLVWYGHRYELRHLVVRLKKLGWLPTKEGRGNALWEKICNVFCLPPSADGKARSLDPDNLRTAMCHKNGAYDRVERAVFFDDDLYATSQPSDTTPRTHTYNTPIHRHNPQATQPTSCPT